METILLLVLVIAVLAYYGFMQSLEVGAGMANREVKHLDDVHLVAITERTAKLADKINDEAVSKAEEVKAKLKIMRGQ